MLHYVAISRLAPDYTLLVGTTPNKSGKKDDENAVVLIRILRAPGIRSSNQHLLVMDDRHLFVEIKEDLAFFAIADKKYPQRLVFSSPSTRRTRTIFGMMQAFVFENSSIEREARNGRSLALKRELGPNLRDIISQMADPRDVDRLARVGYAVEIARDRVVDTLAKATEHTSLLESVAEDSEEIRGTSNTFMRGSRRLHREQCCRYYSRIIFCIVALLLIAGIIVVSLNYTKYHWWGSPTSSSSPSPKNSTMQFT